MSPDRIFAARDPRGFRPSRHGPHSRSSRPEARYRCLRFRNLPFDLIGATYERDVKPGELSWLARKASARGSIRRRAAVELHFRARLFFASRQYCFRTLGADQPRRSGPPTGPRSSRGCRSGRSRARFRRDRGRGLRSGERHPVSLRPDPQSLCGAHIYRASQSVRDFGVKLKLNPVRSLLEGKRVVLIDDSIVRGTTSRKIVRMIRNAGAKEVHMRISCPPTISPCYYGVDTPSKSS